MSNSAQVKRHSEDSLLATAIFRQAKVALVPVTQLAPNLLAVLQHIPTSSLQPCWRHIPFIAKGTLGNMWLHFTTHCHLTPTTHSEQGLARKKLRPPSVWMQLSSNIQLILPANKNQNIACDVRRNTLRLLTGAEDSLTVRKAQTWKRKTKSREAHWTSDA